MQREGFVCFPCSWKCSHDWLSCVLLDATKFSFMPSNFPGSAVEFSARHVAHAAHRSRLHKLLIFQAGFGSPKKDEVFYLENLDSCALGMQRWGAHSYLPQYI